MKKSNLFALVLGPAILVGVMFFSSPALAHLPRLVYKDLNSSTIPLEIKTSEISQAFYGQFKNYGPEYYRVNLPGEQELYLSLLVPQNNSAATGTSLSVIKLNSPDSKFAMTLDGKKFVWTKFYEDYAGDNYWQGPSQGKKLPAGDYLITITSKDNSGKYVLVTGKIESFPIGEMLKTLWALPFLKVAFFETSFFSIFAGIIGKYLLWGVITFLALVVFIVWLIIKRKKSKV